MDVKPPFKPDAETDKVITEGERMERLIEGEDYRLVKAKLLEKILVLDRNSSIDTTGKTFEQIGQETLARAGAVSIIMEVINDIEGIATQSKATREAMSINNNNEIISNYSQINDG